MNFQELLSGPVDMVFDFVSKDLNPEPVDQDMPSQIVNLDELFG